MQHKEELKLENNSADSDITDESKKLNKNLKRL